MSEIPDFEQIMAELENSIVKEVPPDDNEAEAKREKNAKRKRSKKASRRRTKTHTGSHRLRNWLLSIVALLGVVTIIGYLITPRLGRCPVSYIDPRLSLQRDLTNMDTWQQGITHDVNYAIANKLSPTILSNVKNALDGYSSQVQSIQASQLNSIASTMTTELVYATQIDGFLADGVQSGTIPITRMKEAEDGYVKAEETASGAISVDMSKLDYPTCSF